MHNGWLNMSSSRHSANNDSLLAGQTPKKTFAQHHPYILLSTAHDSLHRGDHTKFPSRLLALPPKLHPYIHPHSSPRKHSKPRGKTLQRSIDFNAKDAAQRKRGVIADSHGSVRKQGQASASIYLLLYVSPFLDPLHVPLCQDPTFFGDYTAMQMR